MSFDFPFVRLLGVRLFCYYPYLPWDQVNSELHNDAIHLDLQIKLNQNGKSNKHGTKTFPKLPFPNRPPNEGGNKAKQAYCYSFNNNKDKCERGQSCLFPHVCEKCEGPHHRQICPREQQPGYLSKSNTTSKTVQKTCYKKHQLYTNSTLIVQLLLL